MKDILTDDEIHYPLNEQILLEAEEIKSERKTLKSRIEKLEETKSSVSEIVYQKVRVDYLSKLTNTTERLVSLKKDLETQERILIGKKKLVVANVQLHKEKIEESMLRHALGEYTMEQHEEFGQKEQQEIERLENALEVLEDGISRHVKIFEGEELPPEALVHVPHLTKAAATASAPKKSAPPLAPAHASDPDVPPMSAMEEDPEEEPSVISSGILVHDAPVSEHTARIQPPPMETDRILANGRAAMNGANGHASKKASELLVLENGNVIQKVMLDHTVVIGRSPSSDVVLKEAKVSRKHAEIQIIGGKCVLLDLESSNGTYVGGKKITEYTLQPNDEIAIGNARMIFKS